MLMTSQTIFQSIATVSISLIITSCGMTEVIGRGHCMKTTDGYQVCIKSEEVTCNADSDDSGDVKCSSFGRISSLTGEESSHWSSSREYPEIGDDNGNIYCKIDGEFHPSNMRSFTCEAAKLYSKI